MAAIEITVVAVAIVAFATVSMRVEGWPLTMPMVFVGLGLVTSSIGLVDLDTERQGVGLLAEVTLAVILFSDAVRTDLTRLRRYLRIPARLLGIGLPLTIVLGTVVNRLLFPDLPLAEVALLAAVLAPTDAALGSAVVDDDAVPIRERLALNVESGVNDGLVVPVVTFLTVAAVGDRRSTLDWAGFVAQQIGWGLAVGSATGIGGISLLRWARAQGWSDARYEQLATFMLPVIALFAASALDGNSFIAAFVAGLAFGSFGPTADRTPDGSTGAGGFAAFTDDAAQLLGIAAFFVFGNVLLGGVLADFSVPVVVCAGSALTLGRIVPTWIALAGTGMSWPSRLFIGWFGPRGLASIVFGLLLFEETGDELGGPAEDLFGVIALTVTASVVLHGTTAAWGAHRYARWAEQASMTADERADMNLHDEEGGPSWLPRTRWTSRRSTG